MTTSLRQLLGVTIIAGAIVLSAYEIYELVRVGTCGASPGAVPIRACPDGTGLHVLLLILGIFVLPFLGAYLARNGGLLIAWWCLIWIAMGAASLVAGHGPGAPVGAESGADGVGITFLAIGVLSLLGVLAIARSVRGTPRERIAAMPREFGVTGVPSAAPADTQRLATAPGSAATAPTPAEGSVEARLGKLQELRVAGLITEAELAERRRAILEDV